MSCEVRRINHDSAFCSIVFAAPTQDSFLVTIRCTVTLAPLRAMSALNPKANIRRWRPNVRFVPIADIGNIGRYEKNGPKSGSRTTGRGAQSKCQLRGTGLGTLQVRVILFGRIETTPGKTRAADRSGAHQRAPRRW